MFLGGRNYRRAVVIYRRVHLSPWDAQCEHLSSSKPMLIPIIATIRNNSPTPATAAAATATATATEEEDEEEEEVEEEEEGEGEEEEEEEDEEEEET